MDVEFHQLRYFVAVADRRHFTQAASDLAVAQPSISRQIKKLEAELGAPLFQRVRGRVALTQAGEALLPWARRVLDDIAGLYNAPDAEGFERRVTLIETRFTRLESVLGQGPYFAGEAFSLVDAAFAPVLRYFEVLDPLLQLGVFASKPHVWAWRRALAARPSVQAAVDSDYPRRLEQFLRTRASHLGQLVNAVAASAA